MIASAQRLSRSGVPMREFPQSLNNLTEASNNLLELIRSRRLMMYPAPDIRAAMSRAILIESARGARLGKATQSHRIDIIAALSFAALAATRGGAVPALRTFTAISGDLCQFQEVDPRTLMPVVPPPTRLKHVTVACAQGKWLIFGGSKSTSMARRFMSGGSRTARHQRIRELRALRQHQRDQASWQFVFVSERGAPLNAAGFGRMVERAGRSALALRSTPICFGIRLCLGECGTSVAGVPWAPEYPEHGEVFGASAAEVQMLLAGLRP